MKFISVLLVGFLACYFMMKKKDNIPTKIKTQIHQAAEETTIQPKVVKHLAGKMDLPANSALPSLEPSLAAETKVTNSEQSEDVIKKTKIQFSLEDIMQLEKYWHDLHYDIQVSKEERGWRVKTLAPDSLFAARGLTEGQLITYDSIRTLEDEENSNLPNRISAILDQVSVQ